MKKKLAMLLCLLLMFSLLASCAAETPPVNEPIDTPVTESAPEQTTDEPVEAPEDEPAEEPVAEPVEELEPLPFSEPRTFRMTTYYGSNEPGGNGYKDPSESPMIDELEAATGVYVEWDILTSAESYSLILAAGDYGDVVVPMGNYPGGWTKAVEDGVFMEMTPVIDQYMPNYAALLENYPHVRQEAIADDGSLPILYTIVCNDDAIPITAQLPSGLMVRGDWVEQLGMDLPTTIADWDIMLTGFKEQMGADAPLLIGDDATLQCGGFMTAYNVLPGFFCDGGTIKFGPAEEGYRQWLELFTDWYARGLINPDFVSTRANQVVGEPDYLTGDRSGAGSMVVYMGHTTMYEMGLTPNPDFILTSVPNPVLNEGDTPRRALYTSYLYGTVAVSAEAEDIEAAARWMDYLYSREGMLLSCYGVEGDVYYVDQDGKIQYTDLIMKPIDGKNPNEMQKMYNLGVGVGLNNVDGFNKNLTEAQAAAIDLYTAMDGSMELPTTMSLSQEESEIIGEAYSSIQTYVNEMTCRYIMGFEELSSYDTFVQEMYSMGLQDCIDAYQAAYSRFLAR